jgi:hypothetical protein
MEEQALGWSGGWIRKQVINVEDAADAEAGEGKLRIVQ